MVHTYTYGANGTSAAGQVTLDSVNLANELLGQNVASTVLSIGTAYDDLGRVKTVTSYSGTGGSGTVLNQVQDAYDGWGNLSQEWQADSGPVDTNTPPSVQYVYESPRLPGEGQGEGSQPVQYMRLSQTIYPNGRNVNYNYNAGPQAAVNQIMSRLGSISDNGSGATDAAHHVPRPGHDRRRGRASGGRQARLRSG